MMRARWHLRRALCCGLAALACVTPYTVVAQSGIGAQLDPLLAEAESAAEGPTLSARWEKLRRTPGYLHTLAKAELMRVTGEPNVLAVARRPHGADFLKAFLADPEWLVSYLASGPVPEDTADGLDTLRMIWQADREADAPKFRRLATAVALVFNTEAMRARLREVTTRDVNPLTPVARYQFYKASQKAGRLRSSFGRLAVWELRWVVCAPVENEALAWLQQKVNVPLDEFDAVFSVPRYRGVNDFGNSVQGPLFSAPSRSQYNWAEDVARNGGVCGALSTFGALNAIAHGIPATPVGQPGHCAYAYRMAPEKWTPGFGGGDGGAHYTFWNNPSATSGWPTTPFPRARECASRCGWPGARAGRRPKARREKRSTGLNSPRPRSL